MNQTRKCWKFLLSKILGQIATFKGLQEMLFNWQTGKKEKKNSILQAKFRKYQEHNIRTLSSLTNFDINLTIKVSFNN
jgi:hypothetical protein